MNTPLDDLYLEWLYRQVADPNAREKFWKTLRQLYVTEFVWIVPNDDNRVEDGRDLRYEFIDTQGVMDVPEPWVELSCSMLEMMIALSRRLVFEVDGEARDWFWKLMENLELDRCTDSNYSEKMKDAIDEILSRVIWRTYTPTGLGGLFPLNAPEEDQRQVEIWYQLSAYLLERV